MSFPLSLPGSEDHFMWKEANEAKTNQASAQKRAGYKYQEANKAVQRLEDAIRKGRDDASTKDNLTLNQAEQTLRR